MDGFHDWQSHRSRSRQPEASMVQGFWLIGWLVGWLVGWVEGVELRVLGLEWVQEISNHLRLLTSNS